MQIETRSLERHDTATTEVWFAPLAVFVAWLARFFDQITRMKRIRRTTKFKPNWRDHWSDLRQCEWLRDQTLAAGAAQLLANQSLDLTNFIPATEPPANYGGPCPRTPFEMNRRFLALARFNADPEAAIRAHAARISERLANGSPDARLCRAADHEPMGASQLLGATPSLALILSIARPSKDERSHTQARAPPLIPSNRKTSPQRAARLRPHPHAQKWNRPAPHLCRTGRSVLITRQSVIRIHPS